MVLDSRPGFERMTMVRNATCGQICQFFGDQRELKKQNAFQIPFHLAVAGASCTKWQMVSKPEQFILDMRTTEEKEMIRLNEPAQTYKLTPEIYEERA